MPAGLAELEGAIRAQTTALQDQLATQEWLASKMECVAVVLNGHCTVMEELLAALTSVGQRFGAGLGSGLDARSEALLDRKSTRLNSSHPVSSRMPSSA